MPDQLVVAVVFAVEDKPFLQQLQLVDEKHQEDTDEQCNKRRVERNTKALRYAGNITLYSLVCLGKGFTDATDRADETYGRYRPRNS